MGKNRILLARAPVQFLSFRQAVRPHFVWESRKEVLFEFPFLGDTSKTWRSVQRSPVNGSTFWRGSRSAPPNRTGGWLVESSHWLHHASRIFGERELSLALVLEFPFTQRVSSSQITPFPIEVEFRLGVRPYEVKGNAWKASSFRVSFGRFGPSCRLLKHIVTLFFSHLLQVSIPFCGSGCSPSPEMASLRAATPSQYSRKVWGWPQRRNHPSKLLVSTRASPGHASTSQTPPSEKST